MKTMRRTRVPTVPFAADVFTWPSDEPQLIGSRCTPCGVVTFPAQPSCPRCGALAMERHLLPRRGHLVTWTTQEFLPKEPYAGGETPETFKRYGVGVIELDGDVRVEGRLTEGDPEKLKFGGEVELVIVPFRTDGDTEVVTFAFKPVDFRRYAMHDVAIIGVGLHPFGRFGAKSAIEMGAEAIRSALADAGDRHGRTCSSPSAAASRSTIRTRCSACSAAPASRSWTSTTAAPRRRPRWS